MSQFIADSVWYRTQFWSSFVVAFLPYLCVSLCRINENVCIHAESHNHFSLFISHIFVFFFWWFWKIRHQGQTCKIAHITCYRSTVTTTKQTNQKKVCIQENQGRKRTTAMKNPIHFLNRLLIGEGFFSSCFFLNEYTQQRNRINISIIIRLVRTCFCSECGRNDHFMAMKLHFMYSLPLE